MNLIKKIFADLFADNNDEYNFTLPIGNSEYDDQAHPEDKLKNQKVYPNIDVNLEYINVRFNSLINSDIKIRDFLINVKSKQYKAFIVYIDGMVDDKSINDFILNPLMLKNRANQNDSPQIISEAITNNISVRRVKKFNIADYISDSLLPQNAVEKVDSFDKIITEISSGNCVLFVDTMNYAFDVSVKKFQMRSVSEPKSEPLVKGSK